MHHLSVQHPFPTVLSLQWALTHRSFPGSYLTLLIILEPFLILFEFDARMNFISQMPFQDQFQIISSLAQPLCFSFSRSISVILVLFLVVIWRPKKSLSSKSCLFSRRFVVPTSCYPRELFHLSDIVFLPIRSISEVVFPFLFIGGHRSRRILRPHHFSYRYPIISVLRSSVR